MDKHDINTSKKYWNKKTHKLLTKSCQQCQHISGAKEKFRGHQKQCDSLCWCNEYLYKMWPKLIQ